MRLLTRWLTPDSPRYSSVRLAAIIAAVVVVVVVVVTVWTNDFLNERETHSISIGEDKTERDALLQSFNVGKSGRGLSQLE